MNWKAKLETLRPLINAALAEVGKANGVEMKLAPRGTYDPDAGTFHFKLEGYEAGGDPPELALLRQFASLYDIDLAWLDKDITTRDGKRYRLCGINARSRKCLAKGQHDGKVYTFDARAFWTLERKDAEIRRRTGAKPEGITFENAPSE